MFFPSMFGALLSFCVVAFVECSQYGCLLLRQGAALYDGLAFVDDALDSPQFRVHWFGSSVAPAHGFHIHEIGDTSANCTAAGGHWDPLGTATHALPSESGNPHHRGDLGNVRPTAPDGEIHETITAPPEVLSYFDWLHNNGLAIVNRTFVLHAAEDQGFAKNESLGGAGSRLACCVITDLAGESGVAVGTGSVVSGTLVSADSIRQALRCALSDCPMDVPCGAADGARHAQGTKLRSGTACSLLADAVVVAVDISEGSWNLTNVVVTRAADIDRALHTDVAAEYLRRADISVVSISIGGETYVRDLRDSRLSGSDRIIVVVVVVCVLAGVAGGVTFFMIKRRRATRATAYM
eukprot:TRINITY_DN55712_c0_g1_i1.p2 TRINITY_DN55712_c0_g1~~TRINITY_DN55712_c0_g1_i1.p2  ORF type:complete len:352 (-),score=19.99 TRINITY_DN55712_c0_g1_i1:3085-4140(-)